MPGHVEGDTAMFAAAAPRRLTHVRRQGSDCHDSGPSSEGTAR